MPIEMSSALPTNGGKYASLSEFKFKFNLDDVDLKGLTLDEVGVEAAMNKKRYLSIYKGDAATADVFATIQQNLYKSDEGFETGGSITLKLEQEYTFDPNQLYTLVIPAGAFRLVATDEESSTSIGILAQVPETSIEFYGEEASSDKLIWVSSSPSTSDPLDKLEEISLVFNQEIEVVGTEKVVLYDGDSDIKEVTLSISIDDPKCAIVNFDGEILYNGHNYKVLIPANSIKSVANGLGYGEIVLNYQGSSYKYLAYGRIAPASGSEISYLTRITVPIKTDGELELGRARAPKAYLYEGEGNEPKRTVTCVMGEDGNSWVIPVWDFDLTASNSYRVVMPADQYHLWTTNASGNLVEVKDTSNPELVLTYTTPEILEMPAKVSIESTIPGDSAECERLDDVILHLAPYEFDLTTYMVYASSETPMAVFSDGTTQTNVLIAFTNGMESASISINRPLESGKEYTLTIPANTFVPNANENLAAVAGNEEKVLTFTGVNKSSYPINCNFGDAFTITNIVNQGESATLKLSPEEDWTIDEVTVNDEAATVEDNILVIPDVNEEMNVYVTYKYAGEISFDYETGVDNVMAECPYGISLEPGYVIISDVEIGASIDVYNTVGMLMANSKATQSTMKLNVNPGIVVIVIRNADNKPIGITVKVP